AFRREQEEARSQGRYLGVGFSTYMEICGLAPSRAVGPSGVGIQAGFWESAVVRVHPSGSATVWTGASPHGQGHDTGFAQIVADRIGISPDQVEVVHGDTDRGPDGMEPGLEETNFYDPENFVFPFGAHAAIVEVDGETGKVDLKRYVCVDDCGPAINPLLIDGQVHGGVTHGVAQALYEQVVYDEQGQLVTGTFVDYALPTAAEMPSFETDRTETPAPVNSMGVKGVGEAGTIAAP